MYRVTKRFGHELGLSCAFRQWKADSHCHFVHGYALEIELCVICEDLDERNWCFDFGGFKTVKDWLFGYFDHTLFITHDDPLLPHFEALDKAGGCKLQRVDAVGCERFAYIIFQTCRPVIDYLSGGRATLGAVTVREHGSNSATYAPSTP